MSKPKTISTLTSNQYWGGLNRRFDNRAAVLRRAGFKYNAERNAWVKPNLLKHQDIPASTVMHADRRAFSELAFGR